MKSDYVSPKLIAMGALRDVTANRSCEFGYAGPTSLTSNTHHSNGGGSFWSFLKF
ncbi:MAG: hypothetical protein R3B83_09985 [Nitrospirales bacterium]|nr:hypothetical protein [Nitrospira sp.]MDR4487837.1 hypothetical protein [Nitrospirales bacterium]